MTIYHSIFKKQCRQVLRTHNSDGFFIPVQHGEKRNPAETHPFEQFAEPEIFIDKADAVGAGHDRSTVPFPLVHRKNGVTKAVDSDPFSVFIPDRDFEQIVFLAELEGLTDRQVRGDGTDLPVRD